MVAQKHTISLSKEQSEFLNSQTELSLSKITQMALKEIMERHKIVMNDVQLLQKKTNKLQSYVEKLTLYIETKGLWEDFLHSVDMAGLI